MITLKAITIGLSLLSSGCMLQEHSPRSTTPTQQPRLASPEALFERGRALAARGDANRAEQYITLAIRAGYPESKAIVPLVGVCISASHLRAALDHAEPFLQHYPATWRLRYLVAAIRLALGHAEDAARELRAVVTQRPDAADAHYLLGVIERDVVHDEIATRKSFEAYVEHDPDGPFALETSAWLVQHPLADAKLSARPIGNAKRAARATTTVLSKPR